MGLRTSCRETVSVESATVGRWPCVPSYNPQARLQTMKLNHDSGTNTDVAVISAEDRKCVAETRPKNSEPGKLSLEVFNMTGILDRATLEERLAVLLK